MTHSVSNAWLLVHVDDSDLGALLGDRGTRLHSFADRDEAAEFLCNDYVDLIAEAGAMSDELVYAARARFEELFEYFETDAELIERLNELTIMLRRIVWFGPLAELAELNDPFPCQVRQYYWENHAELDEDDPFAAVPEEEWPTLAEALMGFLAEGAY